MLLQVEQEENTSALTFKREKQKKVLLWKGRVISYFEAEAKQMTKR